MIFPENRYPLFGIMLYAVFSGGSPAKQALRPIALLVSR
jgi:hypothetical protein